MENHPKFFLHWSSLLTVYCHLKLLAKTNQSAKVDGLVWSKWLHKRWCTASLHIVVVQRQAAEVAVELHSYSVPTAIVDAKPRDAQYVWTITTATAKTTGKLEPQLPVFQLLSHTHERIQTHTVKSWLYGFISTVHKQAVNLFSDINLSLWTASLRPLVKTIVSLMSFDVQS